MDRLFQKLKSNHLNMIALGGSIGTGIFLSSGYTIAVAGPGGALLAYLAISIIVYFLMTSLGELSTHRPNAGSFCDYSTIYVGKSFGFAMGYNYWINWAITLAAEISAASIITHYWFPHIPGWIFSALFFSLIFFFNIFTVQVYGELEYWFSLIKVSVIVVFIVLGLIAIGKKPHWGIPNWTLGDAPFHNGFIAFLTVFLFAGFSFQGSELVGVASEETHDPHISIPKSIKLVFWRLVLFYILSIAVISFLIPYHDPRLGYQSEVTMSPYTLVFKTYLADYAASFINLIILIAILSAANASMYSATRILWYLGKTKQAPFFLSRINVKGVPFNALLLSTAIGSLVFLSSLFNHGVLFVYLVQISSLCGFIAWFGIALSHFCFRKNYLPYHGGPEHLIYRAKGYPYAQIISMLFILFIIFAQFLTLGSQSRTPLQLLTIYSSVLLFAILYIVHKITVWIKK